jgi:hypothetical protein
MKRKVVRIGKAQAIRIRKDTVRMNSSKKPRAGWAAAFREMARCGDDALLDYDLGALNRWDQREWEWR